MQAGDMVRSGNLIGIITLYTDTILILKCHDGKAHNVLAESCELVVPGNEIAAQYEEAIRAHGVKPEH